MTVSTRARRPDCADVCCAVLAGALVLRATVAPAAYPPCLLRWSTIFIAICVQATPYVVLGVVLSAAVAAVPHHRLRRVLGWRPVLGAPVAAVVGSALPGCECGTVPLAATLVRRGVHPSAAVSFMLSAPATNPVVLAATAAAFPGRPAMVLARYCASMLVALSIGLLWPRIGSPLHRRGGAAAGHAHGHGIAHELAASLGLCVLGAAAAASLTVWAPVHRFAAVGGAAQLVLAAGLAVALAVCSAADAFIASSFTGLSAVAQLTFMVVGPVVDVKVFAMQAGAFGTRAAARLCTAALTAGVAASAAVGAVLL